MFSGSAGHSKNKLINTSQRLNLINLGMSIAEPSIARGWKYYDCLVYSGMDVWEPTHCREVEHKEVNSVDYGNVVHLGSQSNELCVSTVRGATRRCYICVQLGR